MKLLVIFAALVCGVFVAGCATTPKYTQAQLNSIETREVDASMEETFSAATNALFDAGYTIAMSDRQGGILTGTRGKDNSSARMWVSSSIQDTRFAVSIQVRENGPRLTTTRIKTSMNGEQVVDKKAIDQIWTLMQRQVLMKEPLMPATEPVSGTK